jgi:hypothetical protein
MATGVGRAVRRAWNWVSTTPPEQRPTFARSTWLFLRLLGLIYVAAFWSLGVQVRGLIGVQGILPAADFIAAATRAANAQGYGVVARFFALPTLCWWWSSDAFLLFLTTAGVILALLVTAGIASFIALPLLWLTYLSLSIVGGDFLSFQWDALLLETGFFAIFVAPIALVERPGRHEPRPAARWLLWWLLFRLMFASGLVKLTSGDPTWRNLTALTYHYETQPLPTPLAWYAHLLPSWWDRASVAGTFAIELALPWLIFTRRRLRAAVCAGVVLLQVLIAVTGNYAFFSALTIALALMLLDDRMLRGRGDVTTLGGRWPTAVIAVVAVLTVPVSVLILSREAGIDVPASALVEPIYGLIEPFRSVNGYGLFAVMTTRRPELSVEGSADGVTWLPYEFKYKPGPVNRPLRWVAPHQPRLDWQMWFAALGSYNGDRWVEAFCRRLLEGSPPVLALLGRNPFPDRPPAFVRIMRYEYRFTSWSDRRRTGAIWTRELTGPYSPVLREP